MKRKRRSHGRSDAQHKRQKLDEDVESRDGDRNRAHATLAGLYQHVSSLRQYLLARLCPTSTAYRKISNSDWESCERASFDTLLNDTIVGWDQIQSRANKIAQKKELEYFSQHLPESTARTDITSGNLQQPEVVDFAIWSIFRINPSVQRPSHLLCRGYQRASANGQNGLSLTAPPVIPGIASHFPNSHVESLKSPHWCRLLAVLGSDGDRIMIDLLLHTGMYEVIDRVRGQLSQISGIPASELAIKDSPARSKHAKAEFSGSEAQQTSTEVASRSLSNIKFVRNRMYYARPAANAKGSVRFGMRHIHVLNRYTDSDNREETIHVMKYIFPRQFGLHNVFASNVDRQETAQPFKDYTLREQEISHMHGYALGTKARLRVPRRLRSVVDLIKKLRRQHARCPYTELLRYYCPADLTKMSHAPPGGSHTRKRKGFPSSMHGPGQRTRRANIAASEKHGAHEYSFMDYATPVHAVSAFCKAVLSRVIPVDLWGDLQNCAIVLQHVHHFICKRKSEGLSLHAVLQRIKLSEFGCLSPSDEHAERSMCQSETRKRREIVAELVYYVFDSFLIPLIRTNFHVTESNVHKHRLFYFRHDVWRLLAEPSLSHLKMTMFEELKGTALEANSSNALGISRVRLLPKRVGARPIINLRRRVLQQQYGRLVLGKSINSMLASAFQALKYEKGNKPVAMGASLFSVSDIYPKLRSFRASLDQRGLGSTPLYFVKVDVRACFDSIPQQALLGLLETLVSAGEYRILRHTECRGGIRKAQATGSRMSARYVTLGRPAGGSESFNDLVRERSAQSRAHAIFINAIAEQDETRGDILRLVERHIKHNVVQIGKKLYRQRDGIPQGSVLSNLLCNFFYAKLERDVLEFADSQRSMLLRLLDDFLLVTVDQSVAERFVQVMHQGIPDFGVAIKAEKSLMNFSIDDRGQVGDRRPDTTFPYCGTLIDTATLDLSKDTTREVHSNVSDSLNVEYARLPGRTFHRKALNALKIQLHKMFLDTSFCSLATVLGNLYRVFLSAAERCYAYCKSLSAAKQPTQSRLLIKIVADLIELAIAIMKRRPVNHSSSRWSSFECSVSKRQARCYARSRSQAAPGANYINPTVSLACDAFRTVFACKQTKHKPLVAWLDDNLKTARPASRAEALLLGQACGTIC